MYIHVVKTKTFQKVVYNLCKKKKKFAQLSFSKMWAKKSDERILSFQYAIEGDFIHQNLLSLIHLLQKQSQKLYINSQYK